MVKTLLHCLVFSIVKQLSNISFVVRGISIGNFQNDETKGLKISCCGTRVRVECTLAELNVFGLSTNLVDKREGIMWIEGQSRTRVKEKEGNWSKERALSGWERPLCI